MTLQTPQTETRHFTIEQVYEHGTPGNAVPEGISRRAVLKAAAILGGTAAVVATGGCAASGGERTSTGEAGAAARTTPNQTNAPNPNRVSDAIERNQDAQRALMDYFGSDSISVAGPTTEELKTIWKGSAVATIKAPDKSGSLEIHVDDPDDFSGTYSAVLSSIEKGYLIPDGWNSGALPSGRKVIYIFAGTTLFNASGGDSLTDKFVVYGKYPAHIESLPYYQQHAEAQRVVEALDKAGALS